jgi:hypothetical protein
MCALNVVVHILEFYVANLSLNSKFLLSCQKQFHNKNYTANVKNYFCQY